MIDCLYTINGAGVTEWDGYPADMARVLTPDVVWNPIFKQFWGVTPPTPYAYWQPLGYNSQPAPMKPGLDGGTAEFVRQLTDVHPTGTFAVVAYSEGAIIAADVLDILRDPSSPIAHRYQDLKAVVCWGNPRREQGNVAPGCIDPGGFGIVVPNTVDTPDWWYNFANGPSVPGAGGWDLYTTCSGAKPGSVELKDMRDVWQTVYSGSPGAIAKLIGSSLLPWNWVGAFKAIGAAGSFFGSSTMPHVDYNVSYPIPNDPRDAWRIALDYLTQVGNTAGDTPGAAVQPDTPGPLFPPVRA
jgi:hypothetical protein